MIREMKRNWKWTKIISLDFGLTLTPGMNPVTPWGSREGVKKPHLSRQYLCWSLGSRQKIADAVLFNPAVFARCVEIVFGWCAPCAPPSFVCQRADVINFIPGKYVLPQDHISCAKLLCLCACSDYNMVSNRGSSSRFHRLHSEHRWKGLSKLLHYPVQ